MAGVNTPSGIDRNSKIAKRSAEVTAGNTDRLRANDTVIQGPPPVGREHIVQDATTPSAPFSPVPVKSEAGGLCPDGCCAAIDAPHWLHPSQGWFLPEGVEFDPEFDPLHAMPDLDPLDVFAAFLDDDDGFGSSMGISSFSVKQEGHGVEFSPLDPVEPIENSDPHAFIPLGQAIGNFRRFNFSESKEVFGQGGMLAKTLKTWNRQKGRYSSDSNTGRNVRPSSWRRSEPSRPVTSTSSVSSPNQWRTIPSHAEPVTQSSR